MPDGSAAAKPVLAAITSQLPWPLNSGGHLRTYYLLRALQPKFRVRLLAPCRPDETASVEALRDRGFDVLPASVAKRTSWQEAARALRAAVDGLPYVMYRRHDHQAVRSVLREQLTVDPPDICYLDHLDAAVYLSELSKVPVIADFHNIYSKLARRAADERSIGRRYLRREAKLLSEVEAVVARKVDVIFAVSNDEARYFSELGANDVRCVPNGVDCAAYASLPAGRRSGPPTVLYVGPMTYAPNAAAAEYLATHVMPQVRTALPDARLRIVGRDPPLAIQRLAERPGVEVAGAAPEMLPELAAAHLLAVPLESGGGTRLKILEAFAAGLPVVSTPVGSEGLQVTDGDHLRIVHRPQFAETIIEQLKQPDEGARLARAARELVRQSYDWTVAGGIAASAAWSLWSSQRRTANCEVLAQEAVA